MSDGVRETLKAEPRYCVGQIVRYRDREERVQTGAIMWIEAKWNGYGHGPVEPLIIYSLEHPSYRNRRYYATDKEIVAPLSVRELEGYRYE